MCTIILEGQIFKADFSQCVGSSRCLIVGVSAEHWKWHRRLGHLSFDLLSHLSGLGLVLGLPKLKYQKDLVCAPCRHGKMVATSHPPLTSVMTERPCELFHMDLVCPACVCSAGGKWYVLVKSEILFSLCLGLPFGSQEVFHMDLVCPGSNLEVEE
jgi:hypothetical protein